jgi:hypothetical protein
MSAATAEPLTEEQQKRQQPPKTASQIQDEDWELVGLPSERAIRALKSFCKEMIGTPFLPKSLFKDLNYDSAVGTLLAVCLTGREMKLSPMQSLRSFWLSPDGRLGMYADAMVAIMLREGATLKWERNDREGAVLFCTRGENQYRATFTTEDAKEAELWNKAGNVWKKYPGQMCEARVKGMVFRNLFADMGGAQMYTKEEILDMEETTPGTFSARDEAGDQRAESDPGLALKPKAISAPPAENIIDLPKQDMRQPEPVLAPRERAAEKFFEERAVAFNGTEKRVETPAAESKTKPEPKTKAEAKPQAADPKPKTNPEESKLRERITGLVKRIPGAQPQHISRYTLGYLGDAKAAADLGLVNGALDALDEAIETDASKTVLDLLTVEPEDLGRRVRSVVDQGWPDKAFDAEGREDVPFQADPAPVAVEKPAAALPPAEPSADPAADDLFAQQFGWGVKTCILARRAMATREMDSTRLAKTLKAFKFEALPEEEAQAGLLLYSFNTNAMLLKRRAAEKGINLVEALALVEGFLGGPLTLDTPKEKAALAIDNTLTDVQ